MSWDSLLRAVSYNNKITLIEAQEHYPQITMNELYRLREYDKRDKRWREEQANFLARSYKKMKQSPIELLRHAFVNRARNNSMAGRIINTLIKEGVEKIGDIKQYHIRAMGKETWQAALSEALEFIESHAVLIHGNKDILEQVKKDPNVTFTYIEELIPSVIKDRPLIITDDINLDLSLASMCSCVTIISCTTKRATKYVITQKPH